MSEEEIRKEKMYFEGIKNSHDMQFMVLTRQSDGKSVEIPVSDEIARHIMLYVEKIAPRIPKPVERGNDVESV